MHQIAKVLSPNDVAETGGHQAGMLIPKRPEILDFFPSLDATVRNPKVVLSFTDDSGETWELAFTYYNNALFGGTRNEYRLTRMTKYIRRNALHSGDVIILSRDAKGRRTITHNRKNAPDASETKLRLGNSWRLISIR